MKLLRLTVMLLLFTRCGNYSNEDLEFLSALPTKGALESRLPEQNSQGGGLRGPPFGQTAQGLAVGEPSQLWTHTRNGAAYFNLGIFWVLATIDLIREQPYTSQSKNSRTWGPWEDTNNPGFVIQVTMDRTAAGTFDLKADWKKATAEATAWTTVFAATMSKTATAQRGTGTLRWSVATAKRVGLKVAAEHSDLQDLEVTYQLNAWPAEVSERITSAIGNPPVDYRLKYFADGRGIIRFGFSAQVLGGLLSDEEHFEVETRWLPQGQGRATATVTSADIPVPAQQTECWDTSKTATFIRQTWFGGLLDGAETTCADVVTGFE